MKDTTQRFAALVGHIDGERGGSRHLTNAPLLAVIRT